MFKCGLCGFKGEFESNVQEHLGEKHPTIHPELYPALVKVIKSKNR